MIVNDENAVVVDGLCKSFKLPHEQHSGLKQLLVNKLKGQKGYEIQHVLKNVSFDIKKGEFFGIVGRNGSGKSTLLKLLANIYIPDKGLVKINGSLTPFIELGVGFNPELTGRENVFLNGALLGFSRKEMDEMYSDIVSFAELDKFMDQKLKNYSSGMQVRLAFSIAIRAKSDILILDEVLAVGDEAFQKKCTEYFIKIKKQKQTIILVTHDMASVERFCDRVAVLDSGKLLGIFDTSKGRKMYDQLNRDNKSSDQPAIVNGRWGTEKAKITEVSVNGVSKKRSIVDQGEPLEIKICFDDNKTAVPVIVGIGIHDEMDSYISGPNSSGIEISSGRDVIYSIKKTPFNPGVYRVELAILNDSRTEEYDHIIDAIYFEVVDKKSNNKFGKIELFGEWREL